MLAYKFGAAHIDCRPVGCEGLGVLELTYRGPMSAKTHGALLPRFLDVSRGARALVLRLETSLMLHESAPVPSAAQYGPGSVGAAVVLRPDQEPLYRQYAAALTCLGVSRVLFAPDQLPYARRWAERHALLSQREFPDSPPYSLSPDPAGREAHQTATPTL